MTEQDISFPWYQETDDLSLEQGDILYGITVPSEVQMLSDTNAKLQLARQDIIVLTQTCDLQQDPRPKIVSVAPLFNSEQLTKDEFNAIIVNRRPNQHMIQSIEIVGHEKPPYYVCFNMMTSAPYSYLMNKVQEIVQNGNKRIRMLPPYKEHLSQALAKYFMRVALPDIIEKK